MEQTAQPVRTRVEDDQFVTEYALDTTFPIPGDLTILYPLQWKGDSVKITAMNIDRDHVEVWWMPISDGGLLVAG